MKITPVLAPVFNVSGMPLELRRALDSKRVDPNNAFVIKHLIEDVDEILYFSFLLEGVTVDQMINASPLKFVKLEYIPPFSYNVLVTGSVAEFKRYKHLPEIISWLKHYEKQVM